MRRQLTVLTTRFLMVRHCFRQSSLGEKTERTIKAHHLLEKAFGKESTVKLSAFETICAVILSAVHFKKVTAKKIYDANELRGRLWNLNVALMVALLELNQCGLSHYAKNVMQPEQSIFHSTIIRERRLISSFMTMTAPISKAAIDPISKLVVSCIIKSP